MNITETITACNDIYVNSVNLDSLEKGANALKEIVNSGYANKDNFERADGLFYRTKAKYFTVKYFDGGYLEEDFNLLLESTEKYLTELHRKSYVNTTRLLENLLSVAKTVHNEVKDVTELLSAVQDDSGALRIDVDGGKISYVLELFKQKLATLQSALPEESLFPKHVKIFNVREQVLKDVSDIVNWLTARFNQVDEKDAENFFEKNCSDLSKYDFPYLYTSETLNSDVRNTEKTIIISTPLKDELVFFTRYAEKLHGIKFVELNLSCFSGKSTEFTDKIFSYFTKNHSHLLIFGASGYNEQNREYLFEKLIRYSNLGFFVLLSETQGKKDLYEDFIALTDKHSDFTRLDVGHKYLRLPSFNQAVSLFIQNSMIKEEERTFINKNMPYLGYVGLNKCLYLATQNKEWKDEGVSISQRHGTLVDEYLNNIPSQEQLLPLDWIDLQLAKKDLVDNSPFDYDALHYANPQNIKAIVESDLDLFCKCGLVTRYLTLHGDDYSTWATLDREERERRLTDATKLVASLLHCEYVPVVHVVENDKWEKNSAGGLCIGGGREIVYKDSCTLNYEWVIDCVCHECYHAFQHTVNDNGHREWHLKLLCVTSSRPQEWHENFMNYVDIDKNHEGYMRQIVEADARIFASDCVKKSANKWHLFDLK